MNINQKSLSGFWLALSLLCGTARADFKYSETSRMTGGAMAGMMKVAGAFSKQAREAGAPTVTTQYLKGRKMRRDEGDARSTIIDLDARQIINIDHKNRTYAVMTFEQMRQMIEQQKAKAQEQMAKQKGQKNASANLKITPKISVTDGPGSRTLVGLPAHEVKVDIEMLMEASDPNQPSQSGQVQSWIKADQYVTPAVPDAEQFREFQQAMVKELDWVPGQIFGGNVQVSTSMTELRKNSDRVKGFPLLQYISMGMGAPGQSEAANAGSASAPQQQPSSSEAPTPGAEAAKAIGSMLGGFHRHKKDQQNQDQANAPASSAPAQPSQPGALMEMTVEVTALSTDPLDSALFGPPAGYRQIQPDANQPPD